MHYHERKSKCWEAHERSKKGKKVKKTGLRAKLFLTQRQAEETQMKKTIRIHEKRNIKQKEHEKIPWGVTPAHLPDREGQF